MRRVLITTTMSFALFAFVAGPAVAEPSKEAFAIEPSSFHIVPSTIEAAAHENLTTEFDFAHNNKNQTFNDVRNIVVNLPPGFVGNDNAVPTCTSAQLVDRSPLYGGNGRLPACPVDTAVGQISFDAGGEHTNRVTVPIFNMEVTSPGIGGARFQARRSRQSCPVTVRPGDSGLTVTTPNVTKTRKRAIYVHGWGVPAAAEHDAERGRSAKRKPANDSGGPRPAGIPAKPYLSNPTSCGPNSREHGSGLVGAPEEWSKAETEVPPIVECDRVPFEPSIVVQPTTSSAESPSGLECLLVVPQSWENPTRSHGEPEGHDASTLPVGYTVNPSAGSGLGVCTPAAV